MLAEQLVIALVLDLAEVAAVSFLDIGKLLLADAANVLAQEGVEGPAGGELRKKRDIILVDQRGTGGSNKLICKDSEGKSAVVDDDHS